uniref:RRM domain-containing protein n=1 Tax=Ditylenchus dipsaci TaxID=166011 RepID=A0A915ER90_9BILA
MLVYSIKCGLLARMSTRGLLYNQVNLLHANRSLSSSTCRVSVFPASSSEINSLRRFHKAVVENVPENATKEMLSDYFSKFGTLISAERVQNVDKPEFHVVFEEHKECIVTSYKSSGDSAWVTFSSKHGLNLALANRPHRVNHKKIKIYPSDKNAARKCCLYFGGLTPATTNQMLYDCFSKFGSVVTVNISHKLDTGYPTLYGYATFSSPNEASKFLFLVRMLLMARRSVL